MVVWLAFINMMINWSVMKNTLFKRNTLLNKRSWMQTLTAAQTYFFLRGNKKRNLTCLSESTWIFTSCFCMFVLCEHETALNFCGTSWVWVSIFVFHNLLSVRWTDACLRSPQPHDAKTNTQHNDCFMLHFTPRFFFFASSFNFPFLMSVCLLHQPPSVHLSLALLHHVVLLCWTVSYFQSSLRNLSFPFFFTFLSLPLLLRHSSPTQGHITKLCCHTAFPVRNLFHLCLWTTPTSWQFQSKSHRDALLPKTFLCSHFWMLSGNNFAVAECCLMILVCVILVWEVFTSHWMADNRKWTLLNTLRKAFEWLGCL